MNTVQLKSQFPGGTYIHRGVDYDNKELHCYSTKFEMVSMLIYRIKKLWEKIS
jgi:hypothetical protein